jgi:metallo-beta-lactamase family protein
VERSPEIRAELAGSKELFNPDGLVEVRDVAASKDLDRGAVPSIIISASGMATGGRVLHHLTHVLPDPRNSVIFPGYQAAGTRGRMLVDGARAVKMLGRYVPVRAEIVALPGFSVHADQSELLGWLADGCCEPTTLYVVHGEPDASAALADRIGRELGWSAVVPSLGERVRLD